MSKIFAGGCACGAIRYEVSGSPAFVARCHCVDCRRASGGPNAVVAGFAKASFAIKKGTPKGFDYKGDSGKGLRRNFCPECGARLFTSDLGLWPDLVFVAIGSVDDPSSLEPGMDIYTKSALPWDGAPREGTSFPQMPT
ncbi:MAG: GFA family protein [Candidatus Acidiferrales bacterium]